MIVTRIAPSPTGYLHFGLARTALFSYLYARKHGGKFILRIEDTDVARNKPEYEEDIFEELEWLGLASDERYRQSEHRSRHTECLRKLIADGHAYESEEPSKERPDEQVKVVRLKNPGEVITFTDLIRGDISFDTTELGDFVIARAIDDPLYHLAVVIDDADEGVTHIIRGEDHISNTPRHILIQRALGFSTPAYAHIPLLLMPDRSKMSKRKHQSSVKFYREQGIVPEALINYLALLGWNPGDGREYLSLSDLVESFDLTRVQKGGAVFDETKLYSVNHHWLRELSDAAYVSHLPTYAPTAATIDTSVLSKLIPLLKERARTFREAEDLLQGELVSLYQKPTLIQKDLLLAKEPGRPVAKQALERLAEKLAGLPEGAAVEEIKAVLMPLAEEEERRGKGGRGGVLWPLRYALSGAERSPDPFTIISLIGRHEALDRVQAAIAIL